MTEHIAHKLLSDPLNNVRVLPNDIESMVATVKKPPLVRINAVSSDLRELALTCCLLWYRAT